MKAVRHAAVILAALFVILGIPALLYTDVGTFFGGTRSDAVSGASLDLPDQPSGEFLVLVNRTKHPDTLSAWTDFFSEQPVDVIMEDISCITLDGDAAGIQLARRYQARLAENQMTIRQEDPVLTASRGEWGLFDIIILSREMADGYRFDTVYANPEVAVIEVKGAPV
jgi:hypothetical protein